MMSLFKKVCFILKGSDDMASFHEPDNKDFVTLTCDVFTRENRYCCSAS